MFGLLNHRPYEEVDRRLGRYVSTAPLVTPRLLSTKLPQNINMNLKDREVDRTHEICLCQSEENSYTAKRIQVPPNMTEQEYTKTTLMKDGLYDNKV